MASKFKPHLAIKALDKYYEIIAKSCVENSGQVVYDGENANAIEAFTAQKLVSTLDDNLGIRVHSKVRSLIDYLEGHYRFRERHGAVAGLIDDLEFNIQSYKEVINNRIKADKNQYLDNVRDVVADLIDMLKEIIESYNYIVHDDFSIASDINERIRQTVRCKDELVKINEVYEQLTLDKLEGYVGTNLDLQTLLLKILSKEISRGLNELSGINDKLVERLNKLNRDKEIAHRNHLIDDFAQRYHDNPKYLPNLTGRVLPQELMIVEPFAIKGYASLDSIEPLYQDKLAQIALDTIKTGDKVEPKRRVTTEVTDARSATYKIETDPINTKLDYLFQAVLSPDFKQNLSAREIYKALNVEIPLDDWLLLVMNRSSALKGEIRRFAIYKEKSEKMLPFDGNTEVIDIIFVKDNQFA